MAEVHSGHRYRIVNAKSGTVLDLNANDGESLAGYDWHGGDNQIWEANEEDGFWRFQNVSNGKWLALPADEGPRDGLRVIAADEPFNWRIWPDAQDPETLRIIVPDTPFDVDLTNFGDNSGGTPIEIWGRWEAVNQCWKFEEV